MPVVDTAAGPVGWLDWGEGGPALAMLHASGTGARTLAPLAGLLAADRRVLAVDFDGYGETRLNAPADVLERHLAAACHLFRLAGPAPFDLFGHSMGGFVALLAAARGLVAPRRLVLFEPVAFGALDPADPDDVAAREIDRDATRLLQAAAAAGEPEAGLAAFIGLWNGQDWDRLPDRARAALGRLAPQIALEAPRVSFDATPAAAYAGIGCPVLLLRSAGAIAPMRRLTDRLAAVLPDVRLLEVGAVTHMGPLSAPAACAAAIRQFLDDPA